MDAIDFYDYVIISAYCVSLAVFVTTLTFGTLCMMWGAAASGTALFVFELWYDKAHQKKDGE